MFFILPTVSSPSYNRSCPSVLTVKSRANGRKIVGQQLPTSLDVTCCVRLHTPLHVVACCWEMLRKFETCQTLSQQLPTSLLISDCRSIWWSVCTAPPAVLGSRTRITNGLRSLLGQILPTMQCRSQQSSVCTPLPTRTQQLPTLTPNIICWPTVGLTSSSSVYGFITNQFNDLLPVGLLAQLVERCTGNAEVKVSNPVQAWLSLRNCKSCVYNCDDHPSFNSSLRSSHIWFSYIHNIIVNVGSCCVRLHVALLTQ